MKYLIFKTLDGKNITAKYVPNKSIKLTANRKTVAEFSANELSEFPEVEIQGTKVQVRFGKDQWGMTAPYLEEKGVPLYGTKNGAKPDFAVKQAAGIAAFFGVIELIIAAFYAFMPPEDINQALVISIYGTLAVVNLVLAYLIKNYSLNALYVFLILTVVFLAIQIFDPSILRIVLGVGFLISANNARYGVQIAQAQQYIKKTE